MIGACAGPSTEGPPLGVSVEWGLTGTSALPPDVENISLTTCTIDPETGDEECVDTNCTLSGLTLQNDVDSCRPREGTEEEFGEEPVLVRRGLPTDTPIRFFIEGQDADLVTTHVGQAGPFVLGDGQRRNVTVRMWGIAESSGFPGESIARFLHTTTWLPDGRLLVAGGFDAVAEAECPTDLMLAMGSQCFEVSATDSAIAIDVGTGEIVPLRSSMLSARGGHTATTLPDGRVLLAGGATSALVAFSPLGGMDSGRFQINLWPRDDEGESTAHDTYEIFDAYLAELGSDPERDGDNARGDFFGAGGGTVPGNMNEPRFLHAAAAVPSSPSTVVVAGGMGATGSASSFEVFDAQRAGGPGFLRAGPENQMQAARVAPSAVGVRGQVWIVGGLFATGNDDLAEIWDPGEDGGNGATVAATTDSEFPNETAGGMEAHPEYSLIRPAVAAVGADRGSPLVLGWYGPLCEPDMTAEMFLDPMVAQELCPAPMSPNTRSFTVDAETGITTPTDARAQAFAAAAWTTSFDPDPGGEDFRQRLVVLGGISNNTWSPQRSAEVFDGTVDAGGEARKLLGTGVSLLAGRFLHTSTGVPGLGVVSVGGAEFASRTGLRLVDEVEVYWLQP